MHRATNIEITKAGCVLGISHHFQHSQITYMAKTCVVTTSKHNANIKKQKAVINVLHNPHLCGDNLVKGLKEGSVQRIA